MVRATVRRALVGFAASMIIALLGSASASAAGPCGADFDRHTACPITTSETVAGSLPTTGEQDYYVFYARGRTRLSVTINDTEAPACSFPTLANPVLCSSFNIILLNAKGDRVAFNGLSSPVDGVPIPKTVYARVPAAGGIYFAEADLFVLGTSVPAPYTLTVDGSPNVLWPPCVVPRLRRDTSLAHAERELVSQHCSVGKIRGIDTPTVPRGRVVSLRPRAGTLAVTGARVELIVSGRPRQRTHHRHTA